MNTLSLRKQTSKLVPNFVMAIALVTGSAMVAGHLAPAEAQAQRKQKKDKKSKAQYSKEFLAVYNPLNEAVNGEGANIPALKGQIEQLIPLAQNPDEQIAAGGLVYNAGSKGADPDLQLRGMKMMLASGKVPIDNLGQYNFIAYQLSNGAKDFVGARTYLQRAIDYNFTTPTIDRAGMLVQMAESYFSTEEYITGLDYLDRAIQDRKAQGAEVDERWHSRGVSIAYNNELKPQVYDVVISWVADFPTQQNWRDAVNLARNLNPFDDQQMLDLFRLANRVDALQDKQDYIYYVESADARRLPGEVKEIIEQGYASGAASRDDIYLADQLQIANNRIASDRADLPALVDEAMGASADLGTVMAAADALLSYKDYEKAATLYQKALAMPGADQGAVLTRLGISQIGLNDFAAAKETLGKVQGARLPIAKLWTGYAAMQMGESAADDGPSLGELMGA